MGTFHYIIENPNGGIEQGKINGSTKNEARTNLAKKRWSQPYTLKAIHDITIDEAIEKCRQILERRKNQ